MNNSIKINHRKFQQYVDQEFHIYQIGFVFTFLLINLNLMR